MHREEAIAECKRVALERGDTESINEIGDFWKIDVLLPEAVKSPSHKRAQNSGFNSDAEAIIRHSKSAMEAGLLITSLIHASRRRGNYEKAYTLE